MKKLFAVLLSVMLICTLNAQVYIGPAFSTAGFSPHIGLSTNNVDVVGVIDMPMVDRNISPARQSLSVGYAVTIMERDYTDVKVLLTPYVGIANYTNNYLIEGDQFSDNTILPIGTLRLTKQYPAGGLFGYVSYCGEAYGGIGLVVFPSEL